MVRPITLDVATRLAELKPTEFRKAINRMNGEELRQAMLYFRLGVIQFIEERDWQACKKAAGREVIGSLTDEELGHVALYFYLGVLVFFNPAAAAAAVLNSLGIDPVKELGL